MKKNYTFLLAVTLLFSATFAMAQSYFTDYGTYGRTDNARKLNSLSFLRNSVSSGVLAVNQATTKDVSPIYFDKTSFVLDVLPGDILTVNYAWTGAWMHNIIYVDWNKSMSFTTDGTDNERIGYNGANAGSEVSKPITYTIPANQASGLYRMRLMVDWVDANSQSIPNSHPTQDMNNNGGSVVDIILNVTTPEMVAKSSLLVKINEVNSLLSGTTAGTGVYQYSSDNRTTLQNATTPAQAVYDNAASTVSDYNTAVAALNLAIYNYKITQIMPFKVSNGTNDYWYQVHDMRSTNVYWNIATVSTTANALNRTTTSDINATTQLFRFVKAPAPNVGYYIYSKTDATNPLAAPQTANGSIVRIEAGQPSAVWTFAPAQTNYNLIALESDATRQLNSYGDKISFWNGGSSDPGNNWLLSEVSIATDIQKPEISMRVYRNGDNRITMQLGESPSANTIMTVYNSKGQTMCQLPVKSAATTVDASLAPGLYLVSVQMNGNRSTQKVVLQ